ncbi:MAG: TldD/PmbA family protein, partial [bacterium]
GIGVRVLLDGAWGFACTNRTKKDDILGCVDEALSMAGALVGKMTERGVVLEVDPVEDRTELKAPRPPASVPLDEKLKKASQLEEVARKRDSRVANTFLTYHDVSSRTLLMNTFGTVVETAAPRTIVALRVVASENGIRQRFFDIVGRRAGFEVAEALDPENFSTQAADRAVRLLGASAPPSGKFPVIFDPSIAGLLVHEAFGHNSEADHVWSGESIIAGKMGEQIASPLVTIVDDPTLEGAWGSYDYDAEGVPARPKVLVKNGVLTGLLHSLETAARMDAEPNGSARAESHQFRPVVRMSNTYFKQGKSKLEDMIGEIEYGVLVGRSIGGYVATEKGQFTCHAGESWLIRNGEKAELLRDVAVSGLTLEALRNIDAVSSDFTLSMPGTCGKLGQGVPVDDGGPYMRLRELVVGGTG